MFYIGSSKQVSDYETTRQYLIHFIKKTFVYGNDIGSVLEDETEYDVEAIRPELVRSDRQGVAGELENEQLRIEFKEEYNHYMKRKNAYEDNKIKVYAFLWERCSKSMQHKIESSMDYRAVVKDDPI